MVVSPSLSQPVAMGCEYYIGTVFAKTKPIHWYFRCIDCRNDYCFSNLVVCCPSQLRRSFGLSTKFDYLVEHWANSDFNIDVVRSDKSCWPDFSINY